jgi:aryl-alcohol dehydrogenase-like predicted oxidoreductase
VSGAKRRAYLEENLAAAAIAVSEAELERISRFLAEHPVAGTRYDPDDLARINR